MFILTELLNKIYTAFIEIKLCCTWLLFKLLNNKYIILNMFRLNDGQEQGYGSTALQKQIESLSEAVNTFFYELNSKSWYSLNFYVYTNEKYKLSHLIRNRDKNIPYK